MNRLFDASHAAAFGAAVFVCALCGCGDGRPADRAPTASGSTQPREPKVLLVGIDGLRPDALEAADTPALDSLVAQGCITLDATASAHTVSGPGWSSVLCGVWPDKHRVTDNRFLISDYERSPSIFTRIKGARPEARTAMFANWAPIGERILAQDAIDVRDSRSDTHDDAPHLTTALEVLRGDDELDFAFLYLGELDEAGHAHGFHRDSPEYRRALEKADARVGKAVAALRSRKSHDREDWLVIVATDHGGTIDLSHGRDIDEHRRIPMIVSGDAAQRGALRGTVNQVDVAATALAHLGVAAERAWDLDGRPIGLRSLVDESSVLGKNIVFNGDAEASSPSPAPEVDRGVAGWRDVGAATAFAYGAHKDYPDNTTPGSPARGNAFFVGGNAGESRLVQRIDLSALADRIDRGEIRFAFSGWFGGFSTQRDLAWAEVRWLDARGGQVSFDALPATTLEARRARIGGDTPTGFLRAARDGTVPAETRIAEVSIRFERAEGACDGYADDVELVLSARGETQ